MKLWIARNRAIIPDGMEHFIERHPEKEIDYAKLHMFCFVVDGISHSALEHSMTSQNGRTFVVYYKNRFLTQSWIWRNVLNLIQKIYETSNITYFAIRFNFL